METYNRASDFTLASQQSREFSLACEIAYRPVRSNYIVTVRPLIYVRWHANQRVTTPASIWSKRFWIVISICRNNPRTNHGESCTGLSSFLFPQPQRIDASSMDLSRLFASLLTWFVGSLTTVDSTNGGNEIWMIFV